MGRLGYTNYIAQGGDWGAGVTTWMAKQHVPGLVGVHLNLPILFPPPVEGTPNADEKASIAQLVAFDADGSGYAKIQSTRPQTLGYALADSPVGQAAWIYEKFASWTDSKFRPEMELSRDEMLDNIMLYWLTDTQLHRHDFISRASRRTFRPKSSIFWLRSQCFLANSIGHSKYGASGPIPSSFIGTKWPREDTLPHSNNRQSSSQS